MRELIANISDFLLSKNFNIVLDSIYGGAQAHESISYLKNIAKKHKAKFTLIFLDTKKDVCIERNKKRKKRIPTKDVHKLYDYAYKNKTAMGIIINNDHLSKKEALKRIMEEIDQ